MPMHKFGLTFPGVEYVKLVVQQILRITATSKESLQAYCDEKIDSQIHYNHNIKLFWL